jgi:hypothetical protein
MSPDGGNIAGSPLRRMGGSSPARPDLTGKSPGAAAFFAPEPVVSIPTLGASQKPSLFPSGLDHGEAMPAHGVMGMGESGAMTMTSRRGIKLDTGRGLLAERRGGQAALPPPIMTTGLDDGVQGYDSPQSQCDTPRLRRLARRRGALRAGEDVASARMRSSTPAARVAQSVERARRLRGHSRCEVQRRAREACIERWVLGGGVSSRHDRSFLRDLGNRVSLGYLSGSGSARSEGSP